MHTITLVTGNTAKLIEWQRLLPTAMRIQSVPLDLDEIQSLDPAVIVTDKAQRAFAQLATPVVVEDVSAGLTALNGLPGPFIKYFEKQLGSEALYKLAPSADQRATVCCTICYYDGKRAIVASGQVNGTVGPAAGDSGFGFDFVFIPDGQSRTYAQMGPAAKDAISHRALAIKQLLGELKNLKILT